MKSFFNTIFSLIVLFSSEINVYAMSDYRIIEICKKEARRSTCIRNLKIKRLNLLEGNRIEIPVIPFKK